MATTVLKRVFVLDKQELPDPSPKMTEKAVMQFYANQYPELTNATLGTPEYKGDKVVYEFQTNAGTKA